MKCLIKDEEDTPQRSPTLFVGDVDHIEVRWFLTDETKPDGRRFKCYMRGGLTIMFVDKKSFSLMGGDSSNPSWDKYVNGYAEEYRPHIRAIREAIIAAGLIRTTGGERANQTYFEFEDRVQISFSWRAWGDLMQAIVNKSEGYMAYYM